MKKNTLIILTVIIIGIIFVILAGMYKFNYLASKPGYDVDGNKINTSEIKSNPKNTTYIIDNKQITLTNGILEKEIAPDSASKIVTQYFGNEVSIDLDGDNREDSVFLLTQTTGGSGTFFYVVAALNTEDGWKGSSGFLLGDRISPQTTEISKNPSHKNVIVVNYTDRQLDQSVTVQTSTGKSAWLKLDTQSMIFGEVEQNFSGEANPDVMTLDMKTWTWIKTTYNNDTEIAPNQKNEFTINFSNNGNISATTDCNSMSGSYFTKDNQINFGPIAMTRMFCPESQEQDFAKIFDEVQSFFFTSKGELVMELKFDSGSVILK